MTSSIPENLTPIAPILKNHLSDLLIWCSQLVYARLISREQGHLLVQLTHLLDWGEMETACVTYHQRNGNGRPVEHTVSRLLRALLVKYLYGCSLRELEEKIRYHILVKWFVGYPLYAPGPDHTTLHRFEMYLCVHHPRLFFDTVLQQIRQAFPEAQQQALLGDTFALHANAALESLIKRLRHTAQALLTSYQATAPETYAQLWATVDHDDLFGTADEKTECYLSPSEWQQRLLACITATLNCQHQLRQQHIAPSVQLWLDRLDKIFADECCLEQDENGQLLHLILRTKRGRYRICSATDPEATIRNHGESKKDFGYNVSVLATIHFIHEIQVDTGSRPDGDALPDVFATYLDHHETAPAKLIYDQAAGHGKTAAQIEKRSKQETQLVCKPMPKKKKKQADAFTHEDYRYDPDKHTLTCPNGRIATRVYRSGSGDGDNFRFVAGQCIGCPLRKPCRGSAAIPTTPKSIFISAYHAARQRLETYSQTDEFKQDMKLRPQVERVIAGLVLHNDARRARFRGKAKVDFQMKMCAMAYNLKRWVVLRQGKPTEKRKRFSAPAPIGGDVACPELAEVGLVAAK